MRFLSVFVGKDRGSCGREEARCYRLWSKVPVGVDDAFHRSVAKAIESLFELGPGGQQNESVHHEFAVRAVEDCHGSAGAVEH